MDVVGSEIGQKMRSAIKAKLTELGCYVDDELPDYVMVMVANKRTRAQMEDDLQLFLGDNTELFVNWLHQVLKKLQEVTITTPLKPIEVETISERSTSKERKSKEKKLKDKVKKSDLKKAKRKDKDKTHRKKEEKKAHKSKKKSKHHEMIRPNVPPLLMNMEKDSEPSITDVFAGQILKNHGFSLDAVEDDPIIEEKKPVLVEPKRPILPIIDPATIPSQSETVLSCDTIRDDPDIMITDTSSILVTNAKEPIASKTREPVDDKEEELNEIEAKIEGLKQKLVQQMDSMSEDEDFLNIRTEADELMNDFAEDVFQEIASQIPPVATPPVIAKTPTPPPKPVEPQVKEPPKVTKEPVKEIEVLPQFELNLPKRPVRERLGARDGAKKVEVKEKEKEIEKKIEKKLVSPERYTPEREPEPKPPSKSAKSRRGDHDELPKRNSQRDEPPKAEPSSKRLTSKVSVLERGGGWASRASGGVLRVRPRLRAAPGLLLRAVADAHRSLLNIPPKREPEPQVKRAMVLPMRRCVDAQKIVIQVPADRTTARAEASLDLDRDDEKSSKVSSEADKEYTPSLLSKKFANSGYVPSRRNEHRTSTRRDDTLIIETINIHNPTIDKDKNTQFIVTMDGYHPNAFLAKKLENEGLLNDDDDKNPKQPEPKVVVAGIDKETTEENVREKDKTPEVSEETPQPELSCSKKRLSGSSEESDTQVIIKPEDIKVEKPKTDGKPKAKELDLSPPTKRRKASPIVFNVDKTEKAVERERERTESASSDNQVIVTTATNSHKYDDVPPLSLAERKLMWCRAFPLCRYGPTCAFQHPRCKFAASCTRRSCPYSHTPAPDIPALASHVVPAANYKTISTAIPNMCKYYPSCVNPGCHYYHPKPCRYGAQCINKVECNFYHADSPSNWRYTL